VGNKGGAMAIRFALTACWFGCLLVAAVQPCLGRHHQQPGQRQQKKTDKEHGIKLGITERFQLRSQFPRSYVDFLDPDSPKFILKKEDVLPGGFMTWSFYGGTLEPGKPTPDNTVFFFAMNPMHIRPMMEGLEDLDPEIVKALIKDPQAVVLGKEKLDKNNLRVGDKFKLTGLNYKGIDLEFTIVGQLPGERYGLSGIMNEAYLHQALEQYQKKGGKAHPLANKSVNIIWLKVRDQAAFDRVAAQVEKTPQFADPRLKCESEKEVLKNLEMK
jgi:putative ABC transport system permease protein